MIIAFTGLAQAGKTTAADFLAKLGWNKVSFASPLKRMMAVLTDETDKDARPPELCGKTVRECYQSLGTEWGRNLVGRDIWLRAAKRQMGLIAKNGGRVVCDDVRFDNEAELVHKLGGIVIEVRRAGLNRMEHESESGISPLALDASLANDGSPEDLWTKLNEACLRLGIRLE
jgi:hypothetical protein